jgi:RimJ/RimL family protein N-acetyltransferase
MTARPIVPEEIFEGSRCALRLVTLADANERYVSWLGDSLVNRYLETRWSVHTLDSVRTFVAEALASPDSYLFAILDGPRGPHVGNLKIGPINPHHSFADISYFIGERAVWGRGLATDAIRTATRVGFDRLGLHRLQAGVYAGNVASARALTRAGYRLEGTLRAALTGAHGWEDLLRYGRLRDDPAP